MLRLAQDEGKVGSTIPASTQIRGPSLLIYFVIFSVLAAGSLLNTSTDLAQPRRLFAFLAGIPTILLIGLRYEIGPDWVGYSIVFGYTKAYSFAQSISHVDPGFFTLIWVLHQFNLPFWVLNFICGIVFVAGLTAFCRRQPNPWLAYLIAFPYLIVVIAMSGDRQSVALGLLFFALNAFEQGRLNRFLLLMVVAGLFHGSVLVMVPLALLSYTKSTFQRVLLLTIAAVLAYYLFWHVFHVYAVRYSTDRIQSSGAAYRVAMNALPAIILLGFRHRFLLELQHYNLWRNVSLAALVSVILLPLVPSTTALDRVILYLFPLQFVVFSHVPYAFSAKREQAGQIILLVIAYAAAIQIVFLEFGRFSRFYVPYHSIFSA